MTEAARQTSKPVVVLSNLPAAIDPDVAARLRAAGIPVLEGTRTGLLALGHLLGHGTAPPPGRPRPADAAARRPGPAGPLGRGARGGPGRAGPRWPACCATTASR